MGELVTIPSKSKVYADKGRIVACPDRNGMGVFTHSEMGCKTCPNFEGQITEEKIQCKVAKGGENTAKLIEQARDDIERFSKK